MLPFCCRRLVGRKSKKKKALRVVLPYPSNPRTFGEHLRKRRIDLGLTQPEMAKILGVSNSAAGDWEYGDTRPLKRFRDKIREFMGAGLAATIEPLLKSPRP